MNQKDMETHSSPADQNEKIKSALDLLLSRSSKPDRVQEVQEVTNLGDIILGKAASIIKTDTNYDSYDVAGFILAANADPKHRMKVSILQGIVDFLPAGHPLSDLLNRIKEKAKISTVDKKGGIE